MSINDTAPRRVQESDAHPAPAVAGQTRSPRGPLPEVALTMTDQAGAQVARTQSGPDGYFRLPEPGGGTYILIASRDGYHPHAQTMVLDAATAPLDVTLTPVSCVYGTVHDRHSGAPVAGAAVSAIGPGGDVVAGTASDQDGQYRITGIEDSTVTLVVAAAEAEPVATLVQLDTGDGTSDHAVDLGVDTHSVLRGTVTVDGRAVAGLPLSLRDPHGHTVDTAVTDEAGNYHFDRVKAGNYTVRSVTSAAQASAVSPEATRADITLPPVE